MSKAKENEGKRSGIFQLALVASISLCLSAFEYTHADKRILPVAGTFIEDKILDELAPIDIKIEKPKTTEQRDKPLQKPNANSNQPSTNVVINNNANPNPDVVLINDGDSVIIIGEVVEDIVREKDYTIVEDMPHMKGAAHIKDKIKRSNESDKLLMKELSANIKYPAAARQNGIAGKVMVSFRITKEGKIDDVQVQRSVHPLLDEEAMRVIKALPDFIPGKQRGEYVNVRYVLPIKFELGN